MKFDYLSSVYDSIILKDVAARNGGAKNVDTLQRIGLLLLDSIGSEISVVNISKRLKTNEIGVSRKTLNNYFKLLEEAFVFYYVPKYDIKAARQLTINGKYYIADIGLWNAKIRKTGNDLGHKLENLVFLELLRRGYQVQVGFTMLKKSILLFLKMMRNSITKLLTICLINQQEKLKTF